MQGKLEFLMRPMRNNLTTELLRGAGALLAWLIEGQSALYDSPIKMPGYWQEPRWVGRSASPEREHSMMVAVLHRNCAAAGTGTGA